MYLINTKQKLKYTLAIARFRVQYGQYFPNFSCEIKANMRNEENISHNVRDKRAITSLSLT